MLDTLAQHVDGAALADLTLQASEELAPLGPILAEVKRLDCLGLCLTQECRKLRQVHAVLAVVVVRVAADPSGSRSGRKLKHSARWRGVTGVARHRRAYQPLQPALAGVRRHGRLPLSTFTRLRFRLAWPFVLGPHLKSGLLWSHLGPSCRQQLGCRQFAVEYAAMRSKAGQGPPVAGRRDSVGAGDSDLW